MAIKLNLTSKQILDYTFKTAPRGYDAFEVDKYLDKVIKDYLLIENNSLITKKEYEAAQKKIKELEIANSELLIENQKLKSKVESITTKQTTTVNTDNVKVLKRIDALERELYRLGGNPSKIK